MRARWGVLAVLAGAALTYGLFHPVCVPISAADVSTFDPPIEERTDRGFYLRTFQLRDGQWYQCKTWISRKMFF